MCWINCIHSNVTPPPGVFGGSKCICKECNKQRGMDDGAENIKLPTEEIKFNVEELHSLKRSSISG
jgi:hypothetical protein